MKKALFIFCICFHFSSFAQPSFIISTIKMYKESVINNPKNELRNLKKIIRNIVLDLRYATKKNFTKQKLYKNANTTFLRNDAAFALQALQNELNQEGVGVKVFDAYRPYSVTKLMWDLIHDEAYVANPKNGSGHNRGTSIDLTLINLKTGIELDMGTGFDNFSDSASHDFTPNFNISVIANRNLLRTTMEKYGFKKLVSEWWHYSWNSPDVYDVIDVDFKALIKIVK